MVSRACEVICARQRSLPSAQMSATAGLMQALAGSVSRWLKQVQACLVESMQLPCVSIKPATHMFELNQQHCSEKRYAVCRLAPSPALSLSTSGEDCRPGTSHDAFASWQNATPNTVAPPPLSLSAHRPPWDVYQARQDSISNEGVPCIVLQAAGYAPSYAQRDRR